MTKFKAWISAARLRTLPLSISGIIVGSSLGNNLFLKTNIFWLAIATTLGLQILSNFANDYGDGIKGTDNKDRVGPMRALQSGVISKQEMFKGIVCTAILALGLAISLIYVSFGKDNFLYSLFFFVLGLASIAAAIKYTMGSSAYGYRGLGDVFVFLFFGLVSVVGCFFLYTKNVELVVFLPATTIGVLSAAVLNLNNMRDYDNDKKSGKNTLVVKLGIQRAKIYHFTLLITSMLCMLVYLFYTYKKPIHLLFLLSFIPILFHFIKVFKTNTTELLDPELKKVALTTFLLSILFSLGQIL